MSSKYSFRLSSQDRRRLLPATLTIGRQEPETTAHVLLKLLGYLIFFRERIQIEINLHMDNIPFTPDIVQLDYELRPRLWVECGECSVTKLDKLAVKVPEAEIWVLKRSIDNADHLLAAMAKEELRRNRYNVIGLDSAMFDEMVGLVSSRNELLWVAGTFDPPQLQFDFNGLWFDAPFTLTRF